MFAFCIHFDRKQIYSLFSQIYVCISFCLMLLLQLAKLETYTLPLSFVMYSKLAAVQHSQPFICSFKICC